MEGSTFHILGGSGGAGMFSALEWLMKGAVWLARTFHARNYSPPTHTMLTSAQHIDFRGLQQKAVPHHFRTRKIKTTRFI